MKKRHYQLQVFQEISKVVNDISLKKSEENSDHISRLDRIKYSYMYPDVYCIPGMALSRILLQEFQMVIL